MWNTVSDDQIINNTVSALKANGFNVVVVNTKEEAKEAVLSTIPQQSEVMTMTSKTLDEVGLSTILNDQASFTSSRDALYSLDKSTHAKEMNVLGATSAYTVGSVHAITQQGEVVIASNTGSQLPAYAYSSPHVIWVVGAQKIVKDMIDAMKRINEYVLPLESERAKKAYGVPGSNVSKLLVIHKEVTPNRITIVLVKEVLGF
jgi:L-lactate utilization protein LutC